MLRGHLVQSTALIFSGFALVWAAPSSTQDLPPLPPPDAATTEIDQLEAESTRLSQEARELGGGDTIAQSASNVRTSFYGHKAVADELEQFAEDMGYTEEELRAEQRRIAESGRITFLDVWKGGVSQVVDHYAEEGIERFISAAYARVFGALSLAKDCYEGTRAIKLWLLTRAQAGSLGDSADSIRQNWRLLNELLIAKYAEMAREAAKMRRLDEIQQRYREIRNRIATLRQGGAEAGRPATDHAATGREMDSGYDQLLDQIDKLKFQRKIAELQGDGRRVRELDREIAPLERQAEQAERLPALNRTSSALLNYHNALRFAEGSPPLKWSQTLAGDAAKWAQVMATTGVLQHAPRDSRPANQRENIALTPRAANSAMAMAKVWGGEKKKFRAGIFPNVCSGDWSTCVHYSQMVWSTTTEVGCAFAQGQKFDALVCRYSPPGNQDNKPVFAFGLATTARGPCPPTVAALPRTTR
jgi:hypothetical protein